MKKIFTFIGALIASIPMLTAQTTLTVTHSTPDGMAAEIASALAVAGLADVTTVTTLAITGDANVTFNDCRAIRAAFTTSTLTTLDFGGAKFENDSLPGIPYDKGSKGAFNATAAWTGDSTNGESSATTDVTGLQVTTVVLPANLRIVGNRFFRQFSRLTTITLPPSVERIGPGAFNKCEQLKYINFPDGLKRIDEYAFYQSWRLGLDANPNKSMTELPEGLEGTLGTCAFRETSVFFEYIPEGITAIGSSCFLPGGSASILPGSPTHPHQNEESLGLTIYSACTKIGSQAFKNQKYIDNIEIHRMEPPTAGGADSTAFDGVGNGSLNAVDLYIPIGSKAAYEALHPYKYMLIRDALAPPPTNLATVKKDAFSVSLNGNSLDIKGFEGSIESVRIYNITGAQVRDLNAVNGQTNFDIAGLNNGVYIIQLNNASVAKFIKQ